MTKAKGNMYNWVDSKTLNFLGGACQNSCKYCYTNSLKERFPVLKEKYSGEPRLYEKEFKNLGKGHFYFVGSMVDLFAGNVPDWMIIRVLEHLQKFDNKYLFQTKNPKKILNFVDKFPKKTIICITIETNNDNIIKNISNAPIIKDRKYYAKKISSI